MAAHESPRTTKLYDRTQGAAHAGRGGEDQAVRVATATLTDVTRVRGGDRILPGYIRPVGVNLTALYSYPALPRSLNHAVE